MLGEDATNERESATLPDLGPVFNAAREHLRATVLALIGDGMHDGDPLKCMVTAATALLGQATTERDDARQAAESWRTESGWTDLLPWEPGYVRHGALKAAEAKEGHTDGR